MSHTVGLIVESLVAALLLLTIGYCMVLNKRLKRLKADEQTLRATISELITATEIAERAIGGLKVTVRDCDQKLSSQLAGADEVTDRLKKQTLAGEAVLFRLSRIAMAARPIVETPDGEAEVTRTAREPRETRDARAVRQVRDAKDARIGARSIVAAAEAFAERRRAAGIAA